MPQIYGFASQVVSGNVLDGSVGNRQCDGHRRAPANLARDLQITMVILGDATGDRQTEATATSGRLAGAHEFTHDLRYLVGSDAHSLVFDVDGDSRFCE